MQDKKRSKVGHLTRIFNAADRVVDQEYRRKATTDMSLSFKRCSYSNQTGYLLQYAPPCIILSIFTACFTQVYRKKRLFTAISIIFKG